MDFSNQYFTTAQPYHNFVSVPPPLTPSHSHSTTTSDDYRNTSPPEHFEGFDSLPQSAADQFAGFDFANAAAFNQQPPRFSDPPTPPNHNGVYAADFAQQNLQHGFLSNESGTDNGMKGFSTDASHPDGESAQPRTGSDDDDLTPAQSKRKAQNRAAQRAFRERKEKRVKDLEARLESLEALQQDSTKENERLKRDLQKMHTENEILRATTTSGSGRQQSPETTSTGPMKYSPSDFYSNVLQGHAEKQPSHRIVTSDSGERLLAAGAAWDFIISHELFKRGLVNVGDISKRLRGCARCDGQGPVFSERDILNAMHQSIASGSDDLL